PPWAPCVRYTTPSTRKTPRVPTSCTPSSRSSSSSPGWSAPRTVSLRLAADRMVSTGRTAIVTGADSGIGRAAAVALAADGFDVGITWHTDEAGAESTAAEVREHGARAVVAPLDVADIPACGDVVDGLVEQLG